MSKYQAFNFGSYRFDPQAKELELLYNFDGELKFSERYRFDFEFTPDANKELLEIAIQSLFYMAGVSYYKTYLPPKILLSKQAPLDSASAAFFSKTYQKGLGEFFYVNQLDPETPVIFEPNSEKLPAIESKSCKGQLVGIGGGKDSLVSVELLKDQPGLATWSLAHRPQLTPLVQVIGRPHFWVERQLDPRLLELDDKDALNGHIPISAIFACVGTVVAILSGHRDVITSNESSASEPTLHYRGRAINHQYSKSLEFEQDFQQYLAHRMGSSVRYYSLLRPLSELRIAELFAGSSFDKYKSVFSSCNRAFLQTSDRMSWCGACPKCAFTFLVLTPFVPRDQLEKLWGGKNLLLDPMLESMYRQLLGVEGDKPLDCVGEIKESRAAMRLAQEKYPELKKYQFDLPGDYDFRALSPHSLPQEIYKLLLGAVGN